MQEVLANVPDCHQRGEDLLKPKLNLALSLLTHQIGERPHQESSVDRSLAKMQEAHQQALSATAALEKEIGRLD